MGETAEAMGMACANVEVEVMPIRSEAQELAHPLIRKIPTQPAGWDVDIEFLPRANDLFSISPFDRLKKFDPSAKLRVRPDNDSRATSGLCAAFH